ncbi:relaxase/mobilization nuclease domain-containing protein [Aquimarina mytili]|uniref:Relaxase/mobilization nuclease domain-containing protein n=1 Tax=Aquimarina mytili TaxID=874423 RepID=A0A937A136_9FLAO|nr:relaxase/mobilization nuclease domain-containing protein [Aquimarina mytili]MBL0686076.1 relaxase/mobilization nuclease domain-containing protein [Aquimarina mytili]
MIGEIGYTSSIESLVNYHQTKIQNGVAEILQSHKVQDRSTSQINASFRAYSYLSEEKNPYVHISLSFHPDDRSKLTNEKYKELTTSYLNHLGYHDQPYVLIKHEDQDHPHVHIITTSVLDDGTKIPKFQDRYRSQNISRELEKEHGLTIVSSIKQNKEYKVNLSNKQDLKNYLKSSIKEVMALKPKREEDFLNTLRNQYQIDAYKTKSKGVSFHIFEKEGGIDIQRFEGFGVKGMSGSAINKEYSLNKLKASLQENFKNAPKRYRNLKLAEEKLNDELKYFSALKVSDSNVVLESKGLKVFSENEKSYVIDTKGKNLYSSSDFKDFDFSRFSSTTVLDIDKLPELFHAISSEAFYTYKQDISPYLKESVFLDKIALQDTYHTYLDTSDTFQLYQQFMSEEQLSMLGKSATAYFNNKYSSIEAISKSEVEKEQGLKELIATFANSNKLDSDSLNKLMELVDIKEQYTQHSSIRNTTSLIQAIYQDINGLQKDEEKVYVSPGTMFLHQKYFSAEQLSEEFLPSYEKVISESYIKSAFQYAKSNMISPEDFIQVLNQRGIEIHIEQNEYGRESISASISGLKHREGLRGAKDFVLDTLKSYDQKVEADLVNLQFRKALDDDYGPGLHYLYQQGGISEELKSLYESSQTFQEETDKAAIRDLLREKYYEFRNEFDYKYESDFLVYFKTHIPEFTEFLGDTDLTNKEVYTELYNSFLETKISDEYSREVSRKEEEKLSNKMKLAQTIGGKNTAGLLGVIQNASVATDLYGKYTVPYQGNFDSQISQLQKEPYFAYYSRIFESASKKLFYDQEEFRKDPTGILVNWTFENHIPEEYRKAYTELFTNNYISHYLKEFSELSFKEASDIALYFNSKGIEIDISGETLSLRMTQNNVSVTLDDLKPELLNEMYSAAPYSRPIIEPGTIVDQIRFNLALEGGNYQSAAYILENSDAKVLLSSEEALTHKEPLEEAIVRLEIRTNLNEQYYTLYKDSGHLYESDFLMVTYDNPEAFKASFVLDEGLDSALSHTVFSEFIGDKLGIEYLNNTIEKEENRLLDKLVLANTIGHNHVAALLGVKKVDENTVADINGKYKATYKLPTSDALLLLQNQPFFKYYSSVFEKVSQQIFNESEAVLDPNGILVYKSFEAFIPEEHNEKYLSAVSSNYIHYYVSKLQTYEFDSYEEKTRYLNSKGIRVLSSDGERSVLKLVNHPEYTKVAIEGLKLGNVSTDRQIIYFRENGLLSESGLYKQIEFNNAIENENYVGAAWLLKKGEARNLLSNKELEQHGEQLNQALKSITRNTLYSDILAVTKILMENKYQEDHGKKGQKNKNKKKRKNRRL